MLEIKKKLKKSQNGRGARESESGDLAKCSNQTFRTTKSREIYIPETDFSFRFGGGVGRGCSDGNFPLLLFVPERLFSAPVVFNKASQPPLKKTPFPGKCVFLDFPDSQCFESISFPNISSCNVLPPGDMGI